MLKINLLLQFIVLGFSVLTLSSCAHYTAPSGGRTASYTPTTSSADYSSRLPSHISTNGQRVIVIDPRVHAWGAYDRDGNLMKAGLATAGSNWCSDIGRACRTKTGTFRIQSLGNAGCKSSIYPLPKGGAPMPYCMFFNGHQGLHGSPASRVVEGNVSHGCVRVHVADAEWIRFNFANIGTKVVVKPY